MEAAAHDQTATTERAEKATEELRRMAAQLATLRSDVAAAEAGKGRAGAELEQTRNALSVAHAKRDSVGRRRYR